MAGGDGRALMHACVVWSRAQSLGRCHMARWSWGTRLRCNVPQAQALHSKQTQELGCAPHHCQRAILRLSVSRDYAGACAWWGGVQGSGWAAGVLSRRKRSRKLWVRRGEQVRACCPRLVRHVGRCTAKAGTSLHLNMPLNTIQAVLGMRAAHVPAQLVHAPAGSSRCQAAM